MKLTKFDPAEYLADAESQAELLTAALETGDAADVVHALGVIARAQGKAEAVRMAGLGAPDAALTLDTLLRVVAVLGLRLTVQPA